MASRCRNDSNLSVDGETNPHNFDRLVFFFYYTALISMVLGFAASDFGK